MRRRMAPMPERNQAKRRRTFWSEWKHSGAVRAAIFLFLVAFLYLTLYDHLITETYEVEPGAPSTANIEAKERFVNEPATEREREKAAAEVQPVYTYVSLDNAALIDRIYNQLENVNNDANFSTNEKVDIYRAFFPSEYEWHMDRKLKDLGETGLNAPLLEEIRKQLEDQKYRIPEEMYFLIPRLTAGQLAEMKQITKDIVSRLMSEPLRSAEPARERVPELVNSSSLSQRISREVVQEIARFVITPNRYYDQVAYEHAVEEAKANVAPVYIEAGQLIVREGQVITNEIYEILEQQGLLKEKRSFGPQAGLLLLVLIVGLILFLYILRSDLPIRRNNVQLIMFMLIFFLNVLAMKLVAMGQNLDYPYVGFLAPVAMGSMLIAILLDARLALIASVLFAVAASIIFNTSREMPLFDFTYGFVAFAACSIAVFAIRKAGQRSAVLRAGLSVSLFSAIAILSILLLGQTLDTRTILFALSFGIAGGILTAVLVIGLLPFFEASFGILSPLKLIELSNPNHPLLRKLLTETPGTYHHSVMVGNLAEAAAESIGANGLLCRVGSFYHDIGKTKRPGYFIENQMNGENPHDRIEPELSKAIIVAHAKDGADMLREYKMPKQICDIAEQHHGTTLLKYFYHKALKMREGQPGAEEVREEDFRYPGPKAQSKEAAIVGIADCIEAAVRSLRNPTIEQIGSMVDKIIKDRLDDNQFDECDLTLKELNTIGKTLKETLLGIFHSRIEYPDMPAKQSEQNEEKNESKAG